MLLTFDRQPPRIAIAADEQEFVAGTSTLGDGDPGARDPEPLRHKSDERLIRPPVDRWRGDAELESVAVKSGRCRALRTGLDVQGESPALGRPPRPGRAVSHS